LTTPANSAGDYLALVGATIYSSPAEDPIRDGVILIQGEKMISVGARAQMQFPETGRVAAGLQADLVVFQQNPATNIRALSQVKYTLRAGKIIYRTAVGRQSTA
jgi:hypothetical protein